MDGAHEMLPVKTAAVNVQEEKRSYGATAYTGQRTEGTRNTATRVRRIFSFAQIFFFALSYMSSWEAIASNIAFIFWNGGPRSAAWGYVIVITGVLCQVASMAEMSSVQPIAGAQYHWTHYLAPPSQRRFITWIQGWITWFSWISLLAGVVNIAANMIQTLAIANYPSYVPENWHVVLIMYALLIVMGLLNMYAFWIIPWVELVAGLLHIILWIVFVSVLVTLAPRHTADFVFLEKSALSGWTNEYVSFNLGMLTITWGFVGFDGAVHMSEEVRKARHAVPRAMFWSIVMNGALAYGMVLVFLFCAGKVDDLINSSYPLLTICVVATGSLRAGSAMVGGLLIVNIACALGSVASASRLTWAWSRDGALPAYFSYIDPRHRVPVRSVWLPIFIVKLLSLLNIANYTAFSVIIALSTFGLYQSYLLAIACMLYARFQGRIEHGEWSLGRWGIPINIFAIIYSAYVMVFLVFPSFLPVDANTMNYALPINVFVLLISLVWWFVWGQRYWRGLNKEVVDAVVADSDRNTKD
ncbi:uncharacterized protein Z518_05828 [Rhinocladiella mackenziei CBS 650.93]|uniref:Amino acid permease n=1 Tax=Rhinocladiella mackenziei CBS 650.93 TaxID=1442369 RepID=A0A0D2IP81_9EURO|nr:uncharacterized protein Z518_05828 [Rhinocladiella mackenziei CBS 650.93]KIX04956.1 hypothetical protein Z518_05828 [Rhinocladiella mackenziei CBS 650.93]